MNIHRAVPCREKIPEKYFCRQDGIKYNTYVSKLVNHPRNKKVAFIPSNEHFEYVHPATDHVVKARGLTKLIKGAFFENYEPKYSKEAAKARRNKYKHLSRQTQRREKLSGEEMLRRKVSDKSLKGFSLGNIVHDELCSWSRSQNQEEWIKNHPVLNTYTIKIMRCLKLLKIEPLYGEWPIFDEGIPYATSIDMVGVSGTADGSLVLIEIKTGYEGYFSQSNGCMTRTPLKRVPNSPKNQAFLQCLMAMLTLKHRYGIQKMFGIVIRVDDKGVDVEPIPDPFLKKSDSIYKAVCEYMVESKLKTVSTTQKPKSSSVSNTRSRNRANQKDLSIISQKRKRGQRRYNKYKNI